MLGNCSTAVVTHDRFNILFIPMSPPLDPIMLCSPYPGVCDGAQLLRQLPSKPLLSSRQARRLGQVSSSGRPTNQRLQFMTSTALVVHGRSGGLYRSGRGRGGGTLSRGAHDSALSSSTFFLLWKITVVVEGPVGCRAAKFLFGTLASSSLAGQ